MEIKELRCRDTDSYVAIANALANAGPRERDERLKLRKEVQSSALADGNRLSRELEMHYLKLRKKVKYT